MKNNSLKNKFKSARYINNRRCNSANGFSLLPLALRPRLYLLPFLCLLIIITISVCDIWHNNVFAATSTLTVDIAGSITLDLKPTSPLGTFAESSNSSNISVYTNHSSGYTLGITASIEDSNALFYRDSNSNDIIATIPSLTSSVSATNYADDSYASEHNLNDTWGYKPSTIYDTTSGLTNPNSDYLPAPTSITNQNIIAKTTTATALDTTESYNITIGSRVSAAMPTGSYENTFVITVVVNPIPYTITYSKNTEDAVTNMPTTSSGNTTAETVTNAVNNIVPVRTGYKFLGWCSTTTVINNNTDTCSGTIYNPNGGGANRNYTVDQTSSNNTITLYAMWQRLYNIQFIAGSNIDTIIVADGNNKYKPQYAVNGTNNGATTLAVPENTKLLVTVIPESNYILDSWTSSNTTTERLASNALLTTTYTVGASDETLTASGIAADYEDPTKSYTKMKDFKVADCIAAKNVTDERDGKSYTVAPFKNGSTTYCYMLSNLRLDGGTVLNSSTSNVSTSYTVPANTDSTAHGWANDYCKPYMAVKNKEYYYNWPAATARANDTVGSSSCTNDTDNTVGDICPAGWKLPTYNDVTAALLWSSGNNPGMLATSGRFYSGSQYNLGSDGYLWSSTRLDGYYAYGLYFAGTSARRDYYFKRHGFSVRCMRSS